MLEKLMLIVTSKLKQTIKTKAEMNTSSAAVDELSKHVHNVVDKAISSARDEGRKTVMDRDVKIAVEAMSQMTFDLET